MEIAGKNLKDSSNASEELLHNLTQLEIENSNLKRRLRLVEDKYSNLRRRTRVRRPSASELGKRNHGTPILLPLTARSYQVQIPSNNPLSSATVPLRPTRPAPPPPTADGFSKTISGHSVEGQEGIDADYEDNMN